MKKIVKKQREVSQVWSDASGKPFDLNIPPVELKISFSYGSQYDDSEVCLHYTDQEFEPILRQIKLNLSKKTIKEISKILNNPMDKPEHKELLQELLSKG